MKQIEKLLDLSNEKIGITFGNFDGLHLGHQKLIKSILDECKVDNLKLLIFTYRPHPKIFFDREKSYLINSYREREIFLRELGVDYIYEQNFTKEFSQMKPKDFLDTYLKEIAGNIHKVFFGYDFTFGKGKSGKPEDLVTYLKAENDKISFKQFDEVKSYNETISSSFIRESLIKGEISVANSLLGRMFTLRGLVEKGEQRGRTLGFPTCNLNIETYRCIPAPGVYSTITELNGEKFKSVTNIGTNPTFTSDEKIKIETHILDFNNNIYDEEIIIHFLDYIRGEQKFSSVDDLVRQINEDIKLRESM